MRAALATKEQAWEQEQDQEQEQEQEQVSFRTRVGERGVFVFASTQHGIRCVWDSFKGPGG
jgi:hypothetical protein